MKGSLIMATRSSISKSSRTALEASPTTLARRWGRTVNRTSLWTSQFTR